MVKNAPKFDQKKRSLKPLYLESWTSFRLFWVSGGVKPSYDWSQSVGQLFHTFNLATSNK
jgi:hypothetical protein